MFTKLLNPIVKVEVAPNGQTTYFIETESDFGHMCVQGSSFYEACNQLDMAIKTLKKEKNGMEGQESEKEPLGITPYWLFRSRRIHTIIVAINRYSVHKKPVPKEWFTELGDYIDELEQEAGHPGRYGPRYYRNHTFS